MAIETDIKSYMENMLLLEFKNFDYDSVTMKSLEIKHDFDFFLGHFVGYAKGQIGQKYDGQINEDRIDSIVFEYIPQIKTILRVKFPDE